MISRKICRKIFRNVFWFSVASRCKICAFYRRNCGNLCHHVVRIFDLGCDLYSHLARIFDRGCDLYNHLARIFDRGCDLYNHLAQYLTEDVICIIT